MYVKIAPSKQHSNPNSYGETATSNTGPLDIGKRRGEQMKIKEYRTALTADRQTVIKETGRTYNADGRKCYTDPEMIANFMLDEVGTREAAEEHVYILCFDTKQHLTGLFEASHGSVNESMFPVREIMQKSLLLGAVNIAVTHNHPSGDPTPSEADKAATSRLRNAAEIIGINVIDHIITGGITGYYFSFCENRM